MIKDKKVEISKKDYVTFRYFAFLYDYTGIATTVWTTLLSLFVLWDYFMTQRSFLIAAIAVFMIVSNIRSIFFIMPQNAKQEYDSKTFSNPEFTLSLCEETLTIKRETSSPSNIELKSLYSAFETYLQFCFFVSKNNYIILPKNLLTKEERAYMRSAVKALPRKTRRNPFSVGMKATIKNVASLAIVTLCVVFFILAYKII